MAKRLKEYLLYVHRMSEKEMTEEQRKAFGDDLLVKIGFFQHERLVHLMVTILFALLTTGSAIATIGMELPQLALLTVAFLVLLIPYIRHYYILENGVQKLYEYYDKVFGYKERT